MPQPTDNNSAVSGRPSSPMGTDDSFAVNPVAQRRGASKSDGEIGNHNPTFMQNQIAIQRHPSTTKEQTSALSRQLSTKSNESSAAHPEISVVLSDNSQGEGENEGELLLRKPRSDPTSNVIQAVKKFSLTKSSSEHSISSDKSVQSVHVVGSHPLGTLRIHSPQPLRRSTDSTRHECLKSGDVVIVREVPGNSLIGYDTVAFTVNAQDQFDGIRDIPGGVHFVWGGRTTSSFRNGFWFVSAKRSSDGLGEIHVRRWDKEDEIPAEEVSKAEKHIQKEGLPEIFDKLRSYIQPNSTPATTTTAGKRSTASNITTQDPNLWSRLTSSITGELLSRITGCKEWNEWQVSSAHDHRHKTPLHSHPKLNLSDYKDEVLNFTFSEYQPTFSKESVGQLRTEEALDPTRHILRMIKRECALADYRDLIGEVQFCYVAGVILGNLACMEQWAYVVEMIFRAVDLVLLVPKFFREFIEAVHAQFIYDDECVDGSILDQDPNLPNELKATLTTFKSRLNETLLKRGGNLSVEQSAVGKAFEEFESWLWRWEWDLRGIYIRFCRQQTQGGQWVDMELSEYLEGERGEYEPVVVELDEDGREKGLISF